MVDSACIRTNEWSKGIQENVTSQFQYSQVKQGTNDLVNQRLVGRLNFTGFDVSHTKDNIDFAELAEEVDTWLGEECSIFKGQARTTKVSR